MQQTKKDKKIKKIALVLPSLETGGMERVMVELANYFSINKNCQVHLMLFLNQPKLFYEIDNSVILHINRNKKRYSKVFQLIDSIKFLRNKIKEINPDTVLSFGTQWNNFVIFSLSGLKIKIFVSDRGSPERRYKWTTETLKSILYQKVHGVIAQTNKSAKITKDRFPQANIQVIGNPIREIITDNTNNKENIVVSVGRLIESKHHDKLIEIFRKINLDNWKLVIVGGDSIKQNNSIKLQRQIVESNLEGKVILTMAQKDVEFYYLKAKVFAFTSSVEGFPNVIGEAMSAGLPVVAYDCVAGPSDMIEDDKNGFLIPLFDDKLFEEKLRYLMENEKIAANMGQYAKESIQKFSVTSIGNQFYQFITNA